jgi:hypothetical protein
MRFFTAPRCVAGLCLIFAGSGAGLFAPRLRAADARADLRAMDRAWARYQQPAPNLEVRELFGFVLTAAERGWHPEAIPAVLDLAESMHDRDPASATYGNYRWRWSDPKPDDRNAVEFAMQAASLTWVVYRERLTAEAREKLAAAMTLSAEGMLRHKVDVSYTNIFLMRLANCILIGEATGRPDLVQRGRAWFDEWLAYTHHNGVHEFSSPTYYGVDLADLGALARWAQDAAVRAQAETALRFFWSEIAANWFEPFQGIAGATSRDYGFLTGHGYLDQYFLRAGWIASASPNARPTLEDLTFRAPPANLRGEVGTVPRAVRQRWGAQPWEQATHYVGRHFSLGSAGAAYGAQDKILALTLAGGAQQPIINFSLDDHHDPYGQVKLLTSGGHQKLTHLVPFVASVQRGPEAVLLAQFDPAGKGAPRPCASVLSNFILPAAVELWDAHGRLTAAAEAAPVELRDAPMVFLRTGDTAAALCFLRADDDRGGPAKLEWARDGRAYGAQRLTAVNAAAPPRAPVLTVVWVRAAEGLDDAGFAAFRTRFIADHRQARVNRDGPVVEVRVPGLSGELRVSANPAQQTRIAIAGDDPALRTGILNVNGRDLGADVLR